MFLVAVFAIASTALRVVVLFGGQRGIGLVGTWAVVECAGLLVLFWIYARNHDAQRSIRLLMVAGASAGLSLAGALLALLATYVVLTGGDRDFLSAERLLALVGFYWLLAAAEGASLLQLLIRQGRGFKDGPAVDSVRAYDGPR